MSAVKNITSVATKISIPSTLSARIGARRLWTSAVRLRHVRLVAFMSDVLFYELLHSVILPS